MSMILDKTFCLQGCDISKYQGNVDFFKMKAAGVRFIIIRAGYGTTEDPKFKKYIDGAIKAGIYVGVYWFLYASNTKDSANNASKCITVLAPYKDNIKLGVWADWEYDSDRKAPNLTVNARCDIVKKFLTTVTAYGYQTGIYANQDYIKYGKFTPELIAAYPLWYAFYNEKTFSAYGNKGKGGHPYIWQYTSSGNGYKYGVSSKEIDLDRGYFKVEENKVTPINPALVIKPINPIVKGDPAQFRQIISNIKEALDVDFRLNMDALDQNITDEMMLHLANVVIDIYNGKFVPNTVYALQQLLVWWGYSLTVDGKFGPITENTVATFQRQSGLPITKNTSPAFWNRILGRK